MLVCVETYARVPDPLSELQNHYIDDVIEAAAPAQTVAADLQNVCTSTHDDAAESSDTQPTAYQKSCTVESLLPHQDKIVVCFFVKSNLTATGTRSTAQPTSCRGIMPTTWLSYNKKQLN
ncbi:MAG: hypothetical protein ACQ9MH_26965 [Nitrospinales bacterium]